MADDGLSKREIEAALNKIELAFNNIEDDDALGSHLDDDWVREPGKEPVLAEVPKDSKAES